MRPILAAPLALTLAATACASAGAPPLASTDRPGFSYSAAVVPVGGAQVEVGYTDAQSGGSTYHALGEGLLRLGVGPSTELRVSSNSFGVRADGGRVDHGFEDVKLGVKQRLRAGREGRGLAAASVVLLAGGTLPTGSAGFGAGVWQPEAIVSASMPVTARLSLLSNVGDVYAARGEGRAHRASATLVGAYALSARVGAFAEWAGSRYVDDAASRQQYVDAGLSLTPVPAVQLDVRVGHGLNGVARDRFVGLGLSRRW